MRAHTTAGRDYTSPVFVCGESRGIAPIETGVEIARDRIRFLFARQSEKAGFAVTVSLKLDGFSVTRVCRAKPYWKLSIIGYSGKPPNNRELITNN